MSWISKSLTLDILAITIDGLSKVFDRIKAEPEAVADQSPWPTEQPAPVMQQPTPAAVEQPAAPAPAPQTQPAPAAAPAPQAQPAAAPVEDLRPQAQDALRRIAQAEGNDWILNTLFPHFFVTSLNDIPEAKLPEVIAMATTRLELGATTA